MEWTTEENMEFWQDILNTVTKFQVPQKSGDLLTRWPTSSFLMGMVFHGCSSVIITQHMKAVKLCSSGTLVENAI